MSDAEIGTPLHGFETHMSSLQPRGGLTTRWCVMAAAMAALTTATTIGNAAVLVALRRTRTAPAHYPLASLAAADLLVGLFILPVAAARELFVFQLDRGICSCWKMLDVLCCTASILSLCCLGWERWCGITAPLARARRAKRARLFATLVWPAALVVALPTAFIASPKQLHLGEEKGCPDNTNVGYVFYSAILSFYLPAVVMLVLYARILRALSVPLQIRSHQGRRPCPGTELSVKAKRSVTKCAVTEPIYLSEGQQHNNNMKTSDVTQPLSPKGSYLNVPAASTSTDCCPPSSPLKHPGAPCCIMSRQRRATRTIVRLMGLFLFCWSPFFIMLPADSLCDCVWDSIWQWCTWLGFTNSALNPLVYAAASPSVRRALQASLTSSGRTEMQLKPSVRHL